MADLIPLNALGGDTPRSTSHRDMRLVEVPDLAFASVAARRGREDACEAKLAGWLGTDAPAVAQYTGDDTRAAFWTGAAQWIVATPYSAGEDLAATVKDAVGATGSVTEQTDGWTAIDLKGPHVVAVMELCCRLDRRYLRDLPAQPATGPVSAQRTSIHHIGCFVICLSPEHLRLIGPRSMAQSLFHAVETEMRAI
ncbi:sarcosine oxidase subunit gamma [Sulfitobacter sp. HNIBRBA3233]|uniref:sarcosine oxidase subunit gamma n=1 Tax=Sulfitobacter marinivivus TaxID=3158558 RepID=UPI0032DE5C2A